ncbi:unnamed protein product [Ectocarpus sp. CCAP 1310/34]|nr:unnamed protein product [Ectocarpus sp. CCAP 1310/34]
MTACVRGCRHPLWGGNGACTTVSGTSTCLCDSGYASRDSMGRSSCVPRSVLVMAYATIAVTSLITSIFLLWHASKFRQLSRLHQSTRSALMRFRVLLCGREKPLKSTSIRPLPLLVHRSRLCCRRLYRSFFAAGMACNFSLATAMGGSLSLPELYVLQTNYAVFLPVLMFGIPIVVDFWVQSLPMHLLPDHSFLAKAKVLADEFKVFQALSMGLLVGISVIGSFSFSGAQWPFQAVDTIIVLGAVTTRVSFAVRARFVCLLGGNFWNPKVGLTSVVAHQIIGCIDDARAKSSSQSAKVFYAKTKAGILKQITGYFVLAGANASSAIAFTYTATGRATPIIPFSTYVRVSHIQSCSGDPAATAATLATVATRGGAAGGEADENL